MLFKKKIIYIFFSRHIASVCAYKLFHLQTSDCGMSVKSHHCRPVSLAGEQPAHAARLAGLAPETHCTTSERHGLLETAKTDTCER